MEPLLLTPLQIRHRIWMELGRAAHDRHHEWRTPVLATVDADGMPSARTVVLREADENLAHLDFYVDARSSKVAELAHQPRAVLVFWSKRLSWQLRVQADITIQTSGAQVAAVWERVRQSPAAGDYLSTSAPGSAWLDEPATPTEPHAQPHQLAVLTAQVLNLDWLELARSGHRRARMGSETWDWLTP